jgi:hypothetical protein
VAELKQPARLIKIAHVITQAGYTEQAQSYQLMQQASGVAAQAQNVAATGETEAAAEYGTEANLFQESETAYHRDVEHRRGPW